MRGGSLLTLLLAATMATGTVRAQSDFRIVTTFYPMYVATLNVVGQATNVTVVNMSRAASGCLHDYQVTTADMVTLSRASVLVINGAGLESFLDTVVQQLPGVQIIDASAGVGVIRVGGVPNPHVWVSISRHIQQVRTIAAGLARADPARGVLYQRNAEEYTVKLRQLSDRMHTAVKGVASRDIITFHEAFPYFAEEFGLNVVAVIEREPGAEPGARELVEIIRTIRARRVRAVFVEPQYPSKSAEAIARETGVMLSVLDPVVNGPDSPHAYLRIMERNQDALASALK
jgi:zinc transport system substrate-binding protein